MAKTDKPASNFRNTLAELERLTTALEADELDLDEAISYFEQGSELALSLQKQLEQAEQKIKQVKGKFTAAPAAQSEDTVKDE